MKTFKYVLRQRENKDGSHTIQLRIIENRKAKYITTPYKIYKSYWNADGGYAVSNYKDSVSLNKSMKQFQTQFTKPKNQQGDFLEYWEAYINKLIDEGNIGNADKHKSSMGVFIRYMGDNVNFTDITEEKMSSLLHYLKTHYTNNNTIISYLRKIRRIINIAIEKEFIYIDPFLKLKNDIPKETPTNHRALTFDQLQSLATFDMTPTLDKYRKVWLTLFYLQGARISDFLTLKWKNIEDGYIRYTMYKTDKEMEVDISMSLVRLIEFFNPDKKISDSNIYGSLMALKAQFRDEYLFGFLKNGRDNVPRNVRGRWVSGIESEHMKIGSMSAMINTNLKKIGDVLGTATSTHTAKHTVASQMIEREVSVYDVKDRLGHSSLKTTERYIKGLPSEKKRKKTTDFYTDLMKDVYNLKDE